jgi:hypothetical protein
VASIPEGRPRHARGPSPSRLRAGKLDGPYPWPTAAHREYAPFCRLFLQLVIGTPIFPTSAPPCPLFPVFSGGRLSSTGTKPGESRCGPALAGTQLPGDQLRGGLRSGRMEIGLEGGAPRGPSRAAARLGSVRTAGGAVGRLCQSKTNRSAGPANPLDRTATHARLRHLLATLRP